MSNKLIPIVLPNLEVDFLFDPTKISFGDFIQKNLEKLQLSFTRYKVNGITFSKFNPLVIDGDEYKFNMSLLEYSGKNDVILTDVAVVGYVRQESDTFLLISRNNWKTISFLKADNYKNFSLVSRHGDWFSGGIYGVRHHSSKYAWLDAVLDKIIPLPDIIKNIA